MLPASKLALLCCGHNFAFLAGGQLCAALPQYCLSFQADASFLVCVVFCGAVLFFGWDRVVNIKNLILRDSRPRRGALCAYTLALLATVPLAVFHIVFNFLLVSGFEQLGFPQGMIDPVTSR